MPVADNDPSEVQQLGEFNRGRLFERERIVQYLRALMEDQDCEFTETDLPVSAISSGTYDEGDHTLLVGVEVGSETESVQSGTSRAWLPRWLSQHPKMALPTTRYPKELMRRLLSDFDRQANAAARFWYIQVASCRCPDVFTLDELIAALKKSILESGEDVDFLEGWEKGFRESTSFKSNDRLVVRDGEIRRELL